MRRRVALVSQAGIYLEHRMGVEPMNTGFADQRVSHFATGAHPTAGLELGQQSYNSCTNKNPTTLTSGRGLSVDSNALNLSP